MQQMDFGFSVPSATVPISYVGSKHRLFTKVMAGMLPDGTTEIVSPFCGGSSLEIKLAASGKSVLAADLFLNYIEFYQYFNGRSQEIVDAVLSFYPLSRERYIYLVREGGWAKVPCAIERAAISWAVNKQSHMAQNFTGLNVDDKFIRSIDYFRRPEWQDWRNENITFVQADFRETLAAHPDTLAFCDPPYPGKEKFYGDGKQGKFPHKELRDILAAHPRWILTYGYHELTDALYKGYRFLRPHWTYGYGKAKANNKLSEEVVFLSHEIADLYQQRTGGHLHV